jgi:hypothetical protein
VEAAHLRGGRRHVAHLVGQGAVEADVGRRLTVGGGLAQQGQGQLGLAGTGSAHHTNDAAGAVDAGHPLGQATGHALHGAVQLAGHQRQVVHRVQPVGKEGRDARLLG